jgi:hypothetical protein
LDDFIGQINLDSDLMKEVITTSHHRNTSIFLLVQKANGSLTTLSRENTRFAVMFQATNEEFCKGLHKAFGGHSANASQFYSILQQATAEKYGALMYLRDAEFGEQHYFRFKAPAVVPSGQLPMPARPVGADSEEEEDDDDGSQAIEDNDHDDDDDDDEEPPVRNRPRRRSRIIDSESEDDPEDAEVEEHDRALSDDDLSHSLHELADPVSPGAGSRRSRSHDREVVPIRSRSRVIRLPARYDDCQIR